MTSCCIQYFCWYNEHNRDCLSARLKSSILKHVIERIFLFRFIFFRSFDRFLCLWNNLFIYSVNVRFMQFENKTTNSFPRLLELHVIAENTTIKETKPVSISVYRLLKSIEWIFSLSCSFTRFRLLFFKLVFFSRRQTQHKCTLQQGETNRLLSFRLNYNLSKTFFVQNLLVIGS